MAGFVRVSGLLLALFVTAHCASVQHLLPHGTRRRQATPSQYRYSKVLRLQGGQPSTVEAAGGGIKCAAPLPFADEKEVSKRDEGDGTVSVTFSIQYGLDQGDMVITGKDAVFGRAEVHRAPKMRRLPGDKWEITLELQRNKDYYTYNYVALATGTGNLPRAEALNAPRTVSLAGLEAGEALHVHDSFRSSKIGTLCTAAFDRAMFGRGKHPTSRATENQEVKVDQIAWPSRISDHVTVRFQVFAPRMEAGHSVWVSGSVAAMGAGSHTLAVPLVHTGKRIYVGQVTVKRSEVGIDYSFFIADGTGKVVCKEPSQATLSIPTDTSVQTMMEDRTFNYPTAAYRAAGVAVPVSGLKTDKSMGIGEFLDLKKMVDWCSATGLQLIQVLPINDSGQDPSPYSASSSFALHPSYVRPKSVAEYYEALYQTQIEGIVGWADDAVSRLNKSSKVEHAKVMDEKTRLMDAIFEKVGLETVMKDPGILAWAETQSSWLKTYAAFKVQLDKERQFNNKWWDCTTWAVKSSQAHSIVNEDSGDWAGVARVYFTQYHLHVQLQEATLYAEAHGVALKGDIPIGVTRCSADVWAEPNLFKLDHNAGAPGDPQQDWGFPPYNWNEMHKDNCLWWRRRLQHMEQYFHAYRIDHILGFFRMWEIPSRGGKGSYSPSGGLRENGLRNLRAIQTASNMMICGEDLGDCPPEVGPVLLELGILGLMIQRWCEGHTWKYPYMTVAASSCHDCSPCRLWWNEEWGSAEGWFNFFCKGKGACPGGPPDWVSRHIQKLHFESTAMWTINPIQDYVDMWESLRSQDAKNDIINRPGQTEGCWLWRMHLDMDNLIGATDLNGLIKSMLHEAGRGKTY